MAEALIFDAIRTPRGKGKRDGSLHEVKPVDPQSPEDGESSPNQLNRSPSAMRADGIDNVTAAFAYARRREKGCR